MQNKIFITAIFAFLLMCFSCKKNEPPVQEYYLIVYNQSSDTINVSYHTADYEMILKGQQFDSQIDKATYDNLWNGEAAQNLSIFYKDTNNVKIYLPQSYFFSNNWTTAVDNPIAEWVTNPTWNKQQYERHFKSFTVYDKMFVPDSILN